MFIYLFLLKSVSVGFLPLAANRGLNTSVFQLSVEFHAQESVLSTNITHIRGNDVVSALFPSAVSGHFGMMDSLQAGATALVHSSAEGLSPADLLSFQGFPLLELGIAVPHPCSEAVVFACALPCPLYLAQYFSGSS